MNGAVCLGPFPTQGVPALDICAGAQIATTSGLQLDFEVTGDLGAVRIPGWIARERADDLWRTTCFEAFIWAGDGSYFEINVSPSGQWAVYSFDGYRSGMTRANGAELLDSRFESLPDRLLLSATLDLDRLPLPPRPWRLGLSAVIESTAGAISYWALAHPSDKPDFHHPYSFVLELP